MSSKEVKARLKAAKAAVDRKDFHEVQQRCQEVFQVDEANYTAHVFAGLACLQLGSYQESRQHYKAAIAKQPDGPLAWKGLADYYDKHKAVIQEEQLEAIETYSKLLTFIEGDSAKIRSTLKKLFVLHKEFNHHDDILRCYTDIMNTFSEEDDTGEFEGAESRSQLCVDLTAYLLSRGELSDEAWSMLDRGFSGISEDSQAKMGLRAKYIKRTFDKYMCCEVRDESVEDKIVVEGVLLLPHTPLTALSLLVRLALLETITTLLDSREVISLRDDRKQWFLQLHGLLEESSDVDESVVSLGWAGQAVVGVVDGKWPEARDAVDKAVSYSKALPECWLLSSHIHLRLYDYHTTEQAAAKGLKSLQRSPKFLSGILENGLKLHLAEAYVGMKDITSVEQALSLLTELVQVMSHDYHVTRLLVKAYLLLEKVQSAQEILHKMESSLGSDSHLTLGLQGEVSLAKNDFTAALERFNLALKQQPALSSYHLLRGVALWRLPEGDKKQAYAAFLQAAKNDPFNPEIFLYLGHYQRQITKDLKRAVKCYQKAVDLQPTNAEAAMNLADTLSTTGEEEEAFKVYKKITSDAPPSRTKHAWLRMGLYNRKNQLFNDAIKCFQTVLTVDSAVKHYWECLGETYLARGSYNSALRTFTKCLELDPQSIYCLYQIANIRKVLGLLSEAVSEYTAVLEIDSTYVPALKEKSKGKDWERG